MKAKPMPRVSNYLGMRSTGVTIADTWLEAEEFCYPNGGMTRRAYARFEDGLLHVVKCGIPDTAFSIPAIARIKGKTISGFVSSNDDGFKFTAYKIQNESRAVWRFMVNYGRGYEYEIGEYTREAMKEQRKKYQENCSYPLRVVRGREWKHIYCSKCNECASCNIRNCKDGGPHTADESKVEWLDHKPNNDCKDHIRRIH